MAQYKAPDSDGTYVSAPGRQHPIYRETDSLMLITELEESRKIDEDDPFRPREEREINLDPKERGYLVPDDDYQNTQSMTPLGLKPTDDDDDLYFEEDKEAIVLYDEQQKDKNTSTAIVPYDPSQERADPGPQRQWKYSTANIKQRGNCYRYCCIVLMFLVFMLIFAFISWLLQELFFKDPPPPPPPNDQRPDNETFPQSKAKIDKFCGGTALEADQGLKCREYCEPMFSSCCEPLATNRAYNQSNIFNALNATPPPTFSSQDDILGLDHCQFGDHLRGCSSYAKCAALDGAVDPAPRALEVLCSMKQLKTDATSCQSACSKVDCCYNEEGQGCVGRNFNICMDYAYCQNLRQRDDPKLLVPAAPSNLDALCLAGLPDCFKACGNAKCCADPNSKCFQENFISCLTYSPCNEARAFNLSVPPRYNFVNQAPAEIMYACGGQIPENEAVLNNTHMNSCPEYCEQAACCYQNLAHDNCFRKDPLGCLAWNEYCQTEPIAAASWYAPEFAQP